MPSCGRREDALSLYPDNRIDHWGSQGEIGRDVVRRLDLLYYIEYFITLRETSASSSYIPPMSFEKNLQRLEEIVAQLEGNRLDLNASLGLFEEGVELLRQAADELNETEAKVKELIERADGVLELRDFGG